MNEQCWVLLGSRDTTTEAWRVDVHRPVVGTPSSVDADWSWTLAREESHGDVMGFYHTHPNGAGCLPSPRDILTMQAWCSALGKSQLCLIAEDREPREPAAYVFETDDHTGTALAGLETVETGVFVIKES